jgi:hypothetical protein
MGEGQSNQTSFKGYHWSVGFSQNDAIVVETSLLRLLTRRWYRPAHGDYAG